MLCANHLYWQNPRGRAAPIDPFYIQDNASSALHALEPQIAIDTFELRGPSTASSLADTNVISSTTHSHDPALVNSLAAVVADLLKQQQQRRQPVLSPPVQITPPTLPLNQVMRSVTAVDITQLEEGVTYRFDMNFGGPGHFLLRRVNKNGTLADPSGPGSIAVPII